MSLLNFVRKKHPLLREDQAFTLTTSVAIVCLPHYFELPLWCTITSITFIFYRYLSDLGRPWRGLNFPKLNSWVLYVLCGVCTYLTYFTFNTLQGPEPGTALLVLLASLKLLESRSYRDGMVVLILGYFVLMTWLLFSQSLPTTIYLALAVVHTTASLMSLHSPKNIKVSFAPVAIKDLLKAIPVFVLLFFLFPRFAAPLGGYLASEGTQTGFSGDLNPGDISSLIKSEETAFRVRFLGGVKPAQKDLYWRGSVLSEYSGLAWKKSSQAFEYAENKEFHHVFDQEILIEPRFNKWLFGLETPLRANFASKDFKFTIRMSKEHELRSPVQVLQATLIRVQSGAVPFEEVSSAELQRNLVLYDTLSEKTWALAKSFREGSHDNIEVANRALTHFRTKGFVYSQEPGPVGSVDKFLFEAKRGFCEHYAAVFATLMRAANVPARVVVGFYGGLYNEYGNYLIVRDKEAHSWVEIWSQKEGWKRIDPTRAVSPDRINLEGPNGGLASLTNGKLDLLDKVILAYDYLNSEYTMFLINFDSSKQFELLASLGVNFESKQTLILVCLFLVLVVTCFVAYASRQKNIKLDRVGESYQTLLNLITGSGIEIKSSMGPLEILNATKNAFFHKDLSRVINLYVHSRYAGVESTTFLTEARAFTKSFSSANKSAQLPDPSSTRDLNQ